MDVRKSPTQAEVNTSNSIYLNNVQYTVSDSSVYSVFTPKITTNQSFNFYENGQLVQKNFKVIYKVKDDGGVTVPKKLNIEELTVTTKLSASNSTDSYDDVAEELTNIIARLEALENRVIGIS